MVLAPTCPECHTLLEKLDDDTITEIPSCFGTFTERGGWYCPRCQEVKYGKEVNF